jgi:glutathione S-transferase
MRDTTAVQPPIIVGRSSSHFTRVTRIFAKELRIEHGFCAVHDLMSSNLQDYAGNPALRLPVLQTPTGVWFGTLNICRELVRRSQLSLRVLWPEDFDQPLLSNMQELVVQAMTTEVALIMSQLAVADREDVHRAKLRHSLSNSLTWLNSHVTTALEALSPTRELSYLEVTLFCLVTHLQFRQVVATDAYYELQRFSEAFGSRSSALATSYCFDV